MNTNEFVEATPAAIQAQMVRQKEQEAKDRAEAALGSIRMSAVPLCQDGDQRAGLRYPWPDDVRVWTVIHGHRKRAENSNVALVSTTFSILRMNADKTEAVRLTIQEGLSFIPEIWFNGDFEQSSGERPLRQFEAEGGLLVLPPGAEVTSEMINNDQTRGGKLGVFDEILKDATRIAYLVENDKELALTGREYARNARWLRFVVKLLPENDKRRARLNRAAASFESAAEDSE